MSTELAEEAHPPIPDAEPWNNIERCRHEKEVISTYLSGHPLDDFRYEMRLMTNTEVEQLNHLENLVGKEVRFGGLVSGVKEMLSRKGEQFGSMIIDDYSGSYELSLFGKEHEQFMSYMTPHAALFLEGEIGEKFFLKQEERAQGKTSPYAFKLKKVSLLGNLTDDMMKEFTLNINSGVITPEFTQKLLKLVKHHKGNIPLNIYLVDDPTGYRILFYSRKINVAVTSAFVDDLRRLGLTSFEAVRK